MLRKKTKMLLILGCLFAILVSLLAFITWSPWLSEEIAKEKAIAHFEKSWENANDGCYLKCENCGVTDVKNVLFGQLVTMRYKCGWAGDIISQKTSDIFVDFLGKSNYEVHNSVPSY